MTPEEWADRVRVCMRRLETGEATPHSVTDYPAQYGAIVEVIRAAVAEEREACAALAGGMTGPGNTVDQCAGYSDACRDIAAAIRAQGEP